MPKIQNEKQSPPFRDCEEFSDEAKWKLGEIATHLSDARNDSVGGYHCEEFSDEAKWKLSEIATHLSGARNDSVGGYIPVILRGGYRIGGLSPRG
jgi:hypothetical protein